MMRTVIGWDAEEALASRVVVRARDYAHGHVVPSLPLIESSLQSGEYETAVCLVVWCGVPVTEGMAAEIRRAWLDGRAADDWPVGRDALRRALDKATIVPDTQADDDRANDVQAGGPSA